VTSGVYKISLITLQGLALLITPCLASPELESLAAGSEVYSQHCAQCHSDGSANGMVTALVASPLLKEPPQATARIILFGRRGGEGGGIMPAQASLSDEDIAAVVAYVRAKFVDQHDPFFKEDVAALRRSP